MGLDISEIPWDNSLCSSLCCGPSQAAPLTRPRATVQAAPCPCPSAPPLQAPPRPTPHRTVWLGSEETCWRPSLRVSTSNTVTKIQKCLKIQYLVKTMDICVTLNWSVSFVIVENAPLLKPKAAGIGRKVDKPISDFINHFMVQKALIIITLCLQNEWMNVFSVIFQVYLETFETIS